MTVVNIRGTNGSGKSTIVKRFLQRYPYTEIFGVLGPRRPEAYKVQLPGKWLYVIGPYHANVGGVDNLKDVVGCSEKLVELLERYRRQGHVVFEGVVLSTFYGAVGDWLFGHRDQAVVVFLDTSFDNCLIGLAARQSGHRGTKNVEGKIKAIESVCKRMIDLGIRTETISRDDAFEKIVGWLK
jgi:hypothetical protein